MKVGELCSLWVGGARVPSLSPWRREVSWKSSSFADDFFEETSPASTGLEEEEDDEEEEETESTRLPRGAEEDAGMEEALSSPIF